MLDTLFAAEANDGNQIDIMGIREEVDTFMFEGYDTTSSALIFCLLMLAHHSSVQNQVYEEILNILGMVIFMQYYIIFKFINCL